MENWILIAIGSALALLIASRLRQDNEIPHHIAQSQLKTAPSRFTTNERGFFTVRVIALEFDEVGPVIYINGEFANGPHRLDIDSVMAELSANGSVDNFVPFDLSSHGEPDDIRIGDLINLISPVLLEPGQRGKFRAPMLAPEREERLNEVMERLDQAAQRMVDKVDAEFDNYSLEGEFLEKLESDFINDYVVREIAGQIERELIWRPGRINLTMRFVNSYEEMIEEAPIQFEISREDALSLRDNIRGIILNSLRIELGLEMAGYNAVVYEN